MGGAEFISDTEILNETQGLSDEASTSRTTGDAVVTLIQGSLDIEADPVKKREYRTETPGKHARRMQSQKKSEPPHLLHSLSETTLESGFPPAEDDSLQQAPAILKESQQPRPSPLCGHGGAEWLEMSIVTIGASPRASLTKDNRGKAVGKVDRRERDDAPDGNHINRPWKRRRPNAQQSGNGRRVLFFCQR